MIKGQDEIIRRLMQEAQRVRSTTIVIEFTGEKDVQLHEDLQTQHSEGQAKFLEQPLRAYMNEIFQIISNSYKSNNNITAALVTAGNFILTKARELYPAKEEVKRVSGNVRIK